MSLKVTDVQEALRQFRGLGHDVLSDPRAVHMDGIPYTMPLAHRLNIREGVKDRHVFTSYLSQVEGPLISEITSLSPRFTQEGNSILHRRVTPLVPSRHTMAKSEKGKHSYEYNDDHNVGTHGEYSDAPTGSILWQPSHSTSDYADIHEALRSHKEPNSAFKGITWSLKNGTAPMTSEDMRSFNHRYAMENTLEGAPAGRGLVVVHHKPLGLKEGQKWDSYLYDINSEQLLPHDWELPK